MRNRSLDMSLRAQTPARKWKNKKKSLFCKICTKQGFLGVNENSNAEFSIKVLPGLLKNFTKTDPHFQIRRQIRRQIHSRRPQNNQGIVPAPHLWSAGSDIRPCLMLQREEYDTQSAIRLRNRRGRGIFCP